MANKDIGALDIPDDRVETRLLKREKANQATKRIAIIVMICEILYNIFQTWSLRRYIQYNTTSNPIAHCPKMDGERRDTSASPGKSQQSRPFHEN